VKRIGWSGLFNEVAHRFYFYFLFDLEILWVLFPASVADVQTFLLILLPSRQKLIGDDNANIDWYSVLSHISYKNNSFFFIFTSI
jgi:hypothetical protein